MRQWRRFFVVTACVLVAAAPVGAQTSAVAPRGVPGMLDPMTGRFKLAAPRAVSVAAATTFSGRFVYNFTIIVASALPTTAPIVCTANASAFDTSGGTFYESASAPAIRRGTTATCSVAIPYAWPLTTPASDALSLSYSISAQSQPLVRESVISLPATKIPANGATTTEAIRTVL